MAIILSSHAVLAQSDSKVEAAVPIPELLDLPPLTAKDIAPAASPAAPSDTAASPAPAPVIATAPTATADSAVADRLRELGGGKFDRIIGGKKERAGLAAFYDKRDYAPLWISSGAVNERAKATIAYLAHTDADGLDPADYPTPDFKAATDPDALAEAELKLTMSVLTYARHAQTGRVHYSRVAADIFYNLTPPEPADVLAKLAEAADVGKALDNFEPQQSQYQALKKALADVRSGKTQTEPEKKVEEHVRIPNGKILRPGIKDERVLAVRKRLDIAGDKNSPLYDAAVAGAVKKFQKDADLDADGNLGANTVRALNGERTATAVKLGNSVDTIIVNMERWRWLPRDLGDNHVVVNIPDYTLSLFHDHKLYWKTKIVVGKPDLSTPLISAEMKFITVNPTWNVPPSIIEKEYLPALQEDPMALERIGLKVIQDRDGTVRIYQPPGAGNALGRIRFNFPNKFLVYQHDTPDKHLFARDKRAYSHGCMRVQNPLTYGAKLLSLVLPQERYTEARLENMFGGSEININFPTSIPVHLTYQTAFVDDDGKLQLREDVYGRDTRMVAILKSSERRVADIAVERPNVNSGKPVKMPVGTYGNGGGYGGPSFFDWLFRPPGSIAPGPRNHGRVSAR